MVSSRSLRSSKKQTRLQLQPSSSSSPGKQSYSDAIQDRLANVRFAGSKQRTKIPALVEDDQQSLPTPRPTSPAVVDASIGNPTSPLSSLRTSPALPPRFARTSSEPSSDDDVIPPSSKRRRLSRDIDSDIMNMAESSLRSEGSRSRPGQETLRGSFRSGGDFFSTPSRRSSRLVNVTSFPQSLGPVNSNQRLAAVGTPKPQQRTSNIGSAETSDDDVMVTKPTTRNRRTAPVSKQEEPFVVNDDEVEYITSEEELVPVQSRRHQRKNVDFIVDNDQVEYVTSADEDSHGYDSPPGSQRLSHSHKSPKTPSRGSKPRSKRIQEELAEDLLDLQDSEQDEQTDRSRTRGGPVTTQRDKTREHFELLRRRRAGAQPARIIDSDDDDQDANSDSDGIDINRIGEEPDRAEIVSDEDPVLDDEPEMHAEAYVYDDDDFVVEDQATTGRLGRPSTDIPLQFTSFASAKPKELFPHIIEWMVKNKISPAFNRHDDVYKLSFDRIDDQVKAQAGSRLISSAWNATFKNAILARPGIHVAALPGLDEDLIRTCDACNKSNHPARYEFSFSGKSYYRESLEPVDESDNDEDDENDEVERVSHDEQGHALADLRRHFYLGRFCAANADMGHKLTHWKHRLNQHVLTYLEEQGVLAAEAVVSREKLNKKKREKEAENIVDMMQDTGMISELWQGFQDDLEDAKIGMEGHERKGGRSKGRIGSVRVRGGNGTVREWRD